MAKDQNVVQGGIGARSSAAAVDAPRRKRVSPVQFLREVDAERRKVTWTGWKETWITSVMVGLMVIFTAFFFFGVDTVLGAIVSSVLKWANAE
jgi:preprotein translocase subunit SecE